MRAKTAQEASQLLIGELLTLLLGLGLASTLFLRGREDELAILDIPLILLIVTAVLLVVTVVLVWGARRCFQQSRLGFISYKSSEPRHHHGDAIGKGVPAPDELQDMIRSGKPRV